MSTRAFWLWCLVGVLALAAVLWRLVLHQADNRAQCEAKGGYYLQARNGNLCIDRKALL